MSEIEQQHLVLRSLLKTMNDAVTSHESRNDIYRIFDDVISYSELHFATEERLMVQSGFPETEAHKEFHKELLIEARLFRDTLDGIGEDTFREWFNHWYYANVVTHFLYSDKQLEDHLRQGDLMK